MTLGLLAFLCCYSSVLSRSVSPWTCVIKTGRLMWKHQSTWIQPRYLRLVKLIIKWLYLIIRRDLNGTRLPASKTSVTVAPFQPPSEPPADASRLPQRLFGFAVLIPDGFGSRVIRLSPGGQRACQVSPHINVASAHTLSRQHREAEGREKGALIWRHEGMVGRWRMAALFFFFSILIRRKFHL